MEPFTWPVSLETFVKVSGTSFKYHDISRFYSVWAPTLLNKSRETEAHTQAADTFWGPFGNGTYTGWLVGGFKAEAKQGRESKYLGKEGWGL